MLTPVSKKKLEPWRGNYDELCNFINKSWVYSYNNKSTFFYSKDFLQWYIDSPLADRKQQFAYYENDELVAFTSFIKRYYRYQDIVIPGLFATFASIHPDYMQKKYYYTMTVDIMRQFREEYREKGEPAVVCFYTDQLQPVTRISGTISKETGIAFQKICRVNLRAKVFDTEQLKQIDDVKFYEKMFLELRSGIKKYNSVYDNNIKVYDSDYRNDCCRLVNMAAEKQVFAPHFTEEELDHYFSFREFSKTLVFVESNKVKGLISYRVIDIFGKNNKKKVAFIDWISDQELNKEERKALVMRCLSEIKKAGCITVMFTDLPFLKESSLNSGGFLSYPRDTYLCCYNFDPEKYKLENIKSAYEILC